MDSACCTWLGTKQPTDRRHNMSKALKGKVSVVTGGSRGIGRAICLALADRGADIAIIYQRCAEGAEAVAGEVMRRGVRARTYRCDVADAAQVADMVGSVLNDLGQANIVVNCAGIT